MNSPTIAAMVPGLKPHAEHRAVSGETDTAQGNSFATVLADRSSSQTDAPPPEAAVADPSGKASRPLEGEVGKSKDTSATVGKKDNPHSEEETASALPQIALEIALHARDQARARGADTQDARSAKRAELEPSTAPRVAKPQIATHASEKALDPRAKASDAASNRPASADPSSVLPSIATVGNGLPNSLQTGQAISQHGSRQAANSSLPAGTTVAAPNKRMDTTSGSMSGNKAPRVTPQRGETGFVLPAMQGQPQEHAPLAGSDPGLTTTADIQPAAPVSPAALNAFPTPTSASAVTSPTIATPVQQPGWSTDFSRQVVRVALDSQNGTQTVEMRLDPPELGPLRISLSLNDGMASALFVSAHASVRQAIESALPQLSQHLAQAGISLGDTHVGDQGQAGFHSDSETGHSGSGQRPAGGSDTMVADAANSSRRTVTTNALVDTFA